MKTSAKASLEEAIQNWLNTHTEDDDLPEGLFCHEMALLMTNAAAAVYDANFAGQAYAKREDEGNNARP